MHFLNIGPATVRTARPVALALCRDHPGHTVEWLGPWYRPKYSSETRQEHFGKLLELDSGHHEVSERRNNKNRSMLIAT